MDQGFDVYCGLDVGKSEHHATALNRAGERLFDKPLPQDEARLRELFMTLQHHGTVLIVVDQPNTIGALSVAVARDCGCEVAYLPGLSKAYYERKRAEGKKHNPAIICLARRRCDVIFAMLKNGTLYQQKTPQAA